MPRGGPDIGALLKPDEVREWRSLTVENPKSKPTAAEAAALKEKKAAEKKGKDALLKKVVDRINDASIKKDKIKKALDKAAAEAVTEEVPRPFWLDPPSGTRDFEPAEMKVRNWLFDHMRQTAKQFGFKEYDAPVLEHVELYERKAGEEISQQMYCFTDKEGARVTLRPEMTPSLARMVLNLTNLATGEVRAALPLKWFSIPQCWRFWSVWKSNFGRPTPSTRRASVAKSARWRGDSTPSTRRGHRSTRRCPCGRVGSMAWRLTIT